MKQITKFEFVDVGAGPVDVLDVGPSFRGYYAEVMGQGVCAKAAMEAALRHLEEDGFETDLIRVMAEKSGYFDAAASQLAKSFDDGNENGEVDQDELWEYVVLIRFDVEGSELE